jgi:hypothetical protein
VAHMKPLLVACGQWADWVGRKLLLLMFVLAATQLVASYRESLVLAIAGAALFPAVAGLSALARKPGLIFWAYLAVVMDVGLLQ